jgi:hypothetical protein
MRVSVIRPEIFRYHLGNQSALRWIVDQYRVDEDCTFGPLPEAGLGVSNSVSELSAQAPHRRR